MIARAVGQAVRLILIEAALAFFLVWLIARIEAWLDRRDAEEDK